MDVYEDKLSRPPAAGLSAVVDRTSNRFFTQIPAEKARRLVRRGGFFVLGDKFFAPLRLCERLFFLVDSSTHLGGLGYFYYLSRIRWEYPNNKNLTRKFLLSEDSSAYV
jgi:hypothetical protein